MSIILDALKKAEAARKSTQDNPEPPSVVVSPPAKRNLKPLLLALLLLGAALGGSGLYFVGKTILKRFEKTANLPPPPPPVVKKDDTAEKVAKWREEASAMLAVGNLAEARKRFEQIVKTQPNAEAWNNLGVILKKSGDEEGAEHAYQKAIDMQGDYPEALNNLGAIYLTRPDSEDEALKLFKKAAGLNAQYAQPHFHLGILLERRGLNRQAAEQYQQFLALSPQADEALKEKINERIKKLKAGE